jgi:hypothetical protein
MKNPLSIFLLNDPNIAINNLCMCVCVTGYTPITLAEGQTSSVRKTTVLDVMRRCAVRLAFI